MLLVLGLPCQETRVPMAWSHTSADVLVWLHFMLCVQIYAFDRSFEGAIAACGAPLVGILAERLFGFKACRCIPSALHHGACIAASAGHGQA